jgi:N-acetylglucosamine-6-phosphate deacetylase
VPVSAITAARLLTSTGELILNAAVLIQDSLITAAGPRSSISIPNGAQLTDLGDALLAPAFLDVHIHGSAGHDVMQPSASGQQAMSAFLARHGTAAFLATTVTASIDATLAALDHIATWIESAANATAPVARPIGIHLEGPFISHARCGVHPTAHLQPPDPKLFDRFWQASRGHIRLLTLAPELPRATEFITHVRQKNVRVSLGHSDATAAEARNAVASGAISATHTFNAMRAFSHRDPGILGVALAEDALYAELICDRHHVADEAVRIWARSKPANRSLLITDAIAAAGMPDGTYSLGALNVRVANGVATHDNKLAGSVLTLDAAVANAAAIAELAHAARMASINPAAMLGLTDDLAARANLVALNANAELLATFINGVRV